MLPEAVSSKIRWPSRGVPVMSTPSESTSAVSIAKLTDLLPDLQAALNEARKATGWDQAKLNQIVGHEYEFLGPFTTARIETSQEGGETVEFLVLEFRLPEGRDLARAERLFQKAASRADSGDVRGALPDFKRLVAQFPEVPKYHQSFGLAHLELGNLDAAEDELLHALRLDPRLMDALTTLANVYQKRGAPQTAIPLYRRSIELHRTVYALSNLGAVLAEMGDLPQAIRILEEATQEDATYPNAWCGLGLALAKTGDPKLLPRAASALDTTFATLGDRKRSPQLWDTARQLIDRVSLTWAKAAIPEAQQINETVAKEEAERGGLPVRREEAPLGGVVAKLEYGWVHHRPYHRLLVRPGAEVEREHLIRHELEHLRLVNLARSPRKNRWFRTSAQTEEVVAKALQREVERLQRRGLPPEQVQQFLREIKEGSLGQLYNTPVDLLIESRILEAHPPLAPLSYVSIKGQIDLGLRAAEDSHIRQLTPRTIFRANVAMNAAFALWFEERWPLRTDLVARFQRTESWSLAQRLYAHWKSVASNWTPGAEYEWIDQWAELLGLVGWYGWTDGNEVSPPGESDLRTGTTDEARPPTDPAELAAYRYYLLAALKWVDQEGLGRAREVAAEIAALGTGGIDLHGDRTYTLRSIPGKEFSGRHLVSYLYVCLKAIDPTLDPGIDLHEPYLQALELHRRSPPKGD